MRREEEDEEGEGRMVRGGGEWRRWRGGKGGEGEGRNKEVEGEERREERGGRRRIGGGGG